MSPRILDELELFAVHPHSLAAMAITSDGQTLLSGGGDETLRLWGTPDGDLVRELPSPAGTVRSVAVVPGERAALVGYQRGVAALWDLDSSKIVHQLPGHVGRVVATAVSADGQTMASGGEDGTVKVWTRNGVLLVNLKGHTGWVRALAYNPASDELISLGGEDGTARIWSIARGSSTVLEDPLGRMLACAIDGGGRRLITGGEESGSIRIWDLVESKVASVRTGHTASVRSIAISSDSTLFATGSLDGTTRVWDVDTGVCQSILGIEPGRVGAVAFHPITDSLFVGTQDGKILRWSEELQRQNRRGWRPPVRRSIRVNGDLPEMDDKLGVAGDVDAVASLIAARETQPPLSIAVLGPWGSGKSSFMLQLERATERICREVGQETGDFIRSVRQVRFNAWHYSSSDLWGSLLHQLFTELAIFGKQPQRHSEKVRDDLAATLAREKKRLRDLDILVGALSGRPEDQNQGERQTKTVQAKRFIRAALDVLFPTRQRLFAASILLCIIVALVVVNLPLSDAYVVPAIILMIVALGTSAIEIFRRVVQIARTGFKVLTQSADRVKARRARVADIVKYVEKQLESMDAAARLERFITDRTQSSGYADSQGLMGRAYKDLLTLEADLHAARKSVIEEARLGLEAPPERIVLYIDDLDRCAPSRVMAVLSAINLLMSFDMFVVVVAVDARWLVRCLKAFESSLFPGNTDGRSSQTAGSLATQYLDKIFQVPVVLPEFQLSSNSYLEYLLSGDAESVPESIEGWSGWVSPTTQTAGSGPGDRASPVETSSPVVGNQQGVEGESIARDRPVKGLRLRFHGKEKSYIPVVSRLLPTPRSAKKFVNLYRLMRLRLREDQLPWFLGETGEEEPFKLAISVLALSVGAPATAVLMHEKFDSAGDDEYASLVLADIDHIFLASASTADRHRYELFKSLIDEGRTASAREVRRWLSEAARYTFESR